MPTPTTYGLPCHTSILPIWIRAVRIIRINAHNKFFSNVPYQMIGFSYNSRQEFSAVLTQPYILAEREATEDEIVEYMEALDFEMSIGIGDEYCG